LKAQHLAVAVLAKLNILNSSPNNAELNLKIKSGRNKISANFAAAPSEAFSSKYKTIFWVEKVTLEKTKFEGYKTRLAKLRFIIVNLFTSFSLTI